ncbi:MAG TPA: GyrI-like domain-containing protein [Gemmatimonadales bacterium]|jgi:predicted transcriptional regulator YdeE|nr:GyrI-like domain-containing protein [Gemmatimonadales bacterium]
MTTRPQRRPAKAKRVAGLALRTDNASEARPDGKIPGLWQRFRSEDWFGRLGDLGAFGPPLGVYSAYESDVNGSFQLLAGREIKPSAKVPAPLHVVEVPAGTYLVFESSGPLPGSVVKGWQAVWAHFEKPDAPARAYTCDFEIYPNDHTVEIWVAIRPTSG